MPKHPHLPRRKSIRLQDYNYAWPGAYFVTIVTNGRRTLFGNVIDGEMRLNGMGKLMVEGWEWLAVRYPYVQLDEYVIMPNHLHGIIVLDDRATGGSRTAPTGSGDSLRVNTARRKPLGRLIGAFKTVTTKKVNLANGTPGQTLWQRNYYERVIRDDAELDRARKYIVNNPLQWELDRENPDAIANRRRPRRP